MIEQAREILHRFNYLYGDTLVAPEILLPSNKASLRLPGTDGKQKMSKSLGNCIYLSDSAETVNEKVMGMYTDPNHIRVEDPGEVEGNPVFTYLDAFATDEDFTKYLPDYENLDALKDHYSKGGLGDVKIKRFLANVLNDRLEPMRERRAYWQERIPEVYEILEEGSKKARKKAQKTTERVRRALKINYFEDETLLKHYKENFLD